MVVKSQWLINPGLVSQHQLLAEQPWSTTIVQANRNWSTLNPFSLSIETVDADPRWTNPAALQQNRHQHEHHCDYHHPATRSDAAFKVDVFAEYAQAHDKQQDILSVSFLGLQRLFDQQGHLILIFIRISFVRPRPVHRIV